MMVDHPDCFVSEASQNTRIRVPSKHMAADAPIACSKARPLTLALELIMDAVQGVLADRSLIDRMIHLLRRFLRQPTIN